MNFARHVALGGAEETAIAPVCVAALMWHGFQESLMAGFVLRPGCWRPLRCSSWSSRRRCLGSR